MNYALVTATIRNETIECPYCRRRLPVQRPGLYQIRATCNPCETEFQVTDAIAEAKPLPNMVNQLFEEELRSRGLAYTPENFDLLLKEADAAQREKDARFKQLDERLAAANRISLRKPWWKFW